MGPVLRRTRSAPPCLGLMVLLVVLLVSAGGCATSPARPEAAGGKAAAGRNAATTKTTAVGKSTNDKAATSQPSPNPADPDQARARKNARIIGEVRAILKAKHSPLPELQKKPTDSREHPRAQVINDTPYRLTVWFAGPCGDKLEAPPKGSAELRFCPGKYHLAAKVESPDFFPLVREDQQFELGIDYVLRIIIRAQPQVIRRLRKR